MARKKSAFEDLMDISSRLPWMVGIVLALIAYLCLHYFATNFSPITNPVELKAMGKSLGDGLAKEIWKTLASVLQYIIPLGFLVGSAISFMRQRNKSETVEADLPVCPKCGSAMVKRVAKSGKNSGNAFWGCSQYPACRGTRN